MEVYEKEYRFDSEEEMREFLNSKGLADEIAKTIKERMEKPDRLEGELEEKVDRSTTRMGNAMKRIRDLHNERGFSEKQWLKIIKAHNKCAQILEETYAEVK